MKLFVAPEPTDKIQVQSKPDRIPGIPLFYQCHQQQLLLESEDVCLEDESLNLK